MLCADGNDGDGAHGKDKEEDDRRQTVVDKDPGPWI